MVVFSVQDLLIIILRNYNKWIINIYIILILKCKVEWQKDSKKTQSKCKSPILTNSQ